MSRKRIVLSYRDYDRDHIQTSFVGGDASTDVTFAADLAAAIALRDAVNNITLGAMHMFEVGAVYDYNPNIAPPAVQTAQTHIQCVVRYRDTVTGQLSHQRIGTFDITKAGILKPGSQDLDLVHSDVAAFIAAFNAWVVSDVGNPVEVDNIYLKE